MVANHSTSPPAPAKTDESLPWEITPEPMGASLVSLYKGYDIDMSQRMTRRRPLRKQGKREMQRKEDEDLSGQKLVRTELPEYPQNVSRSGGTVLPSRQPCLAVPVSPDPRQREELSRLFL